MLSKQVQQDVYSTYYTKGVEKALNQVKLAGLSDRNRDNLLYLLKAIERESMGSTLRSNTLSDGIKAVQAKKLRQFPFIRSALLVGNTFMSS